ncbi:hypothetical protein ACKKBG_A31780 [Auxenochlorella protothecoides x Auxenochlorella symbiontica]
MKPVHQCSRSPPHTQALCRCGMDHADAGQVLDSGLGLQLRIRFAAAVQGGEAGSEEQLVPHSVATVCLAVDDGTCHRPVLNRELRGGGRGHGMLGGEVRRLMQMS